MTIMRKDQRRLHVGIAEKEDIMQINVIRIGQELTVTTEGINNGIIREMKIKE